MVSQHALTLDVTEDASSFDFFDPLAYPTADPLGHIWPHLALPVPQLRLASDIGSIDSIFARNNSVTFSPAVAVASTVEYPFTFELNGVDKGSKYVCCWSRLCADATCSIDAGTGSDEGRYVDPRVGFESMPPSPTIAIGDIEQKDSNDGMSMRLPVSRLLVSFACFNADKCIDLQSPQNAPSMLQRRLAIPWLSLQRSRQCRCRYRCGARPVAND